MSPNYIKSDIKNDITLLKRGSRGTRMSRKSPKLTKVKYTYADTPKETSPYLKEYIKTS